MARSPKRNLFARLLPSRPGNAGNEPRSFGREDFVTEAVAAVLDADARAGGDLTREVLGKLFGIALEGPVTVHTQMECPDRGARTSWIDLAVLTENDVLFLENKTGSGIGLRDDVTTGGVIDQLQKYRRELDAARVAPERRHLAMLTWAPEDEPSDRTYWRGQRRWWDLHAAIAAAAPSPTEHANALRAELHELFELLDLAPPTALRRENLDDAANVQRVLAMALHEARVPDLSGPRPGSGGSYLFELRGAAPPTSWSFGFAGGTVFARVVNGGYRRATLPDDFIDMAIDAQVRAVAELLRRLPSAPVDSSRIDALSESAFVAQFGASATLVQGLLDRTRALGWSPAFGSAEVALSHPDAAGRLYLSASYAAGPRLRCWWADERGRAAVLRFAEAHGVRAPATGESVSVPFGHLDASLVETLLDELRTRPVE